MSNDDPGIDDIELDDNFDEFKESQTLAGLLQDPKAKIGAILGGAALVFGAILLFGGEKKAPDPSFVGGGSKLSVAPGTQEASPAYVEAVKESNEAEVERAIREGGSALPVPIDPPVGRLSLENDGGDEPEDPLQRWRRLQEERLEKELKQADVVAPPPTQFEDVQQQEVIQKLADLMSQQMQSILEQQSTPAASGYLAMTGPEFLEKEEEELEAAKSASTGQAGEADIEPVEILLPAGQIAYAQLLTEANTDAPGPVLAEIMSGPLLGSRILGSFEEQQSFLTLNFDTVVIDGISYSIDAVGLDPDTTLPGMATEVDHRLLQRMILPAAAAFIEGAATAIAESGTTTVTINNETVTEESQNKDQDQEIATGVQEAGEELSDYFSDMADEVKTLIRIEAGTPLGILFLQPVTKSEQNL